jgi:polyribonucleotide nucleotidyltransferase
MQTQEQVKKIELNGEEMIFKFGKLAPRAEAAVTAQIGETVVLTTVSMNSEDSTLDYFPLTIEYIEKYYAGGLISSSRFQKREGRPSDSAVLKARQIDHSIRSLFPKSFKKEVNLIVTVLAYDGVHDPEILAVNSASLALMLSSIPFFGPSASVRMGIKDSQLMVNPGNDIKEELDAEFMVSVREDRILNIEGWGAEVPEDLMGKLMEEAVKACQPLLKGQIEFSSEAGKKKMEYADLPAPEELIAKVKETYTDKITEALYDNDNRQNMMKAIKAELLEGDAELAVSDIDTAVEYVGRKIMRTNVMTEEKRTSGRKLTEIRELEIDVDLLPRVHGSALFRRGKTQALTITTLGSTRMVQTLESFEGESTKSFMHYYNGPAYSLGEAGRFSYYPGRREVGHGNITENAMKKMLPSTEEFPYTIRVVSEILSQQGSSSMAAACGTTLSLMAAGVPLKAPVAGISVGLVTEDGDISKYKLLTDIADLEDYYGDMDYKVTGTSRGVTAIQLDNKLMGVPVAVLQAATMQSREARLQILEEMAKVIDAPRAELSKYAPRVKVLKINPERIGAIIGPGGKNIKSIIERAGKGVDINIEDDGTISITAATPEGSDIAVGIIESMTEEAQLDKIYTGQIDKVMAYGAFVDVSENISGLLHVSEMSENFVKDPTQIVKEGQIVKVKVTKIDGDGRISFSMKGVPQPQK